jgi:hypothetical protein
MATGGLEETGATQDTANHERPAANKVAESDLDMMFPFQKLAAGSTAVAY